MAGLLVSCCNIDGVGDGYVLAYRDLATQETFWVDITPVADRLPDYGVLRGTTGLCRHGARIFACLRGMFQPALILEFDDRLRVQSVIEAPGVKDIHSIRFYDNALYMASTGNNRIIRLDLTSLKAETYFEWPSDGEFINIHLNDYIRFGGQEYILAHTNPFMAEGNRSGFVYGINSRRVVTTDLLHPHTLYADAGALYVLDSDRCAVVCVSTPSTQPVRSVAARSLLRGWARVGDEHWFALSSRRLYSRKQGVFVTHTPPDTHIYGDDAYLCSIVCFNDRSDEEPLMYSFSECAFEIYDMLPVDRAPAPGVLHPQPAAVLRAQAMRSAHFELARALARERGEDDGTIADAPNAFASLQDHAARRRVARRTALTGDGQS